VLRADAFSDKLTPDPLTPGTSISNLIKDKNWTRTKIILPIGTSMKKVYAKWELI
jgi:hypothetical protein